MAPSLTGWFCIVQVALMSHARSCSGFFPTVQLQTATALRQSTLVAMPMEALRISVRVSKPWILASSFYGKFDSDKDEEDEDEDEEDDEEDDEDEDDEDDEDEDDEYANLDDDAVANFRNRLVSDSGPPSAGYSSSKTPGGPPSPSVSSSIDELISYARSQSAEEKKPVVDWARPAEELAAGVVLVANPAKFCTDFGGRKYTPSPTLLSKFGLTLPPPVDLGPDRRADLLPVLILVDFHRPRGARAVLLNRRTGYLLGDLEQPPSPEDDASSSSMGPAPILEKFCIQPLWFGGVDNVSSGLDMLHQCSTVEGAKAITEDGLYWGGDPAQAQDAMSDPSLERVMTGFDFKFFVQSTTWSTKEIEKEIESGTWFKAIVSKEVLFKSRDRMGTRRAKPLWTEIMELLSYNDVKNQFYGES